MRRRFVYPVLIASLLVPALAEPSLLGSLKMVVTLLAAVLGLMLQPAYDPKASTTTDRGTAAAFAAVLLLFNSATMIEAQWRAPDSLDWNLLTVLSVLLVAGGLTLRTWAVRTLGRYFTLQVTVTSGQPVIRVGPYRYVRHPAYSGALLLLLGMPLLWSAWTTLGVGSIAFGVWFWTRIRQEEKVLVETLGPPYEDYMRSVPALIPRFKSS